LLSFLLDPFAAGSLQSALRARFPGAAARRAGAFFRDPGPDRLFAVVLFPAGAFFIPVTPV
jgi:hypothetical protein